MNTDYRPIDCDLHSHYERYVIEGTPLLARWDDGQEIRTAICRARDLYTRQGEEFIVLEQADGERVSVRLDRIVQLQPQAFYAQ